MAVRLTIEASGQTVIAGRATRITVFGTASLGCPQVRVRAATSISGVPIFSGIAEVSYPPPSSGIADDPASDGRFVVEFAAPGAGLACATPIFVSVECLANPAFRRLGWRPVTCKMGSPGHDGGDNGGNGDDGSHGSNGGSDWPFLDPPSILCPLWGRVFVNMLLPAMLVFVAGLSFGQPAVVGVGLFLLAGAMAWYVFWRRWCVPPTCGVLRAWTWVLKRCTSAALGLAILQMFIVPNVLAWLLVPTLGVPVGWLVTALRNRRCSIPPITATVHQLSLW
jgi:hypothetical protein